jgi:predicted ester cyclase
MEEIIRRQRATVDEHIDLENAHNWPAVCDTFASNESAIEVVPLHVRFGGFDGISNFYQAVGAAFPDFEANVFGECDSPGCSVREITVQGTHRGEWCGIAATGRRVKFHVAVLYLFGKDTSAKLLAERLLLRQRNSDEADQR